MTNKPDILLSALAIGESPRWHDNRLWFCNWGRQEVIAVDINGNTEVMLHTPFTSFPFCIDWLPDGQLLMTSSSEQILWRMADNGSLVAHSDLSAFEKGWNEIVVDTRGNAYINGAAGIIFVNSEGEAIKVANNIEFPNGMIVTPDNSTLIVAESQGKKLTAFNIASNGNLLNRRVWADLKTGVPDGICMDAEESVWYADVPNKRCVRVREGGEILQVVEHDRGCFSCTLGGEEMKTLFITAAIWRGFENIFNTELTGQVLTVKLKE